LTRENPRSRPGLPLRAAGRGQLAGRACADEARDGGRLRPAPAVRRPQARRPLRGWPAVRRPPPAGPALATRDPRPAEQLPASVHRRASPGFSLPATVPRPGEYLRAGICRSAGTVSLRRPHPAGTASLRPPTPSWHRFPEAAPTPAAIRTTAHISAGSSVRSPPPRQPSARPPTSQRPSVRSPTSRQPSVRPPPRQPSALSSGHRPQPPPPNSQFTPPAAAPQPTARCRPVTGSPASGTPG